MTTHTIFEGDVIDGLRTMPDNLVHCVVTSPPYFALRNYNVEGQIGQEETPDQFIQKIVEVFREVRRVLRNDGILWLNFGDSYAGSGRGPTGKNGLQNAEERQGFTSANDPRGPRKNHTDAPSGYKAKDLMGIPWRIARAMQKPYLKCNDCGNVAHYNLWGKFPNGRLICPSCNLSKGHTVFEDGWYLRSGIPWIKRNCMPESCQDRPTSAIEYIFLMAKSPNYFYDQESIRVPASETYRNDPRPAGILRQCVNENSKYPDAGQFKKKKGSQKQEAVAGNKEMSCNGTNLPGHSGILKADGTPFCDGLTRNRRNSDWFFESWQGLLVEDGEPLAFVINPQPRPEKHYASFPDLLAETCIKAGTSEYGCCPKCGAPYRRVVETTGGTTGKSWHPHANDAETGQIAGMSMEGYRREFKGWQPSCDCNAGQPVPCVVLDPFMGSGTVAVVARALNRSSIGCELNPEYVKIIKDRLQANSQLDTGVVSYQFRKV